MSAIRGKYINGTVVLETPADWPNGLEVVVRFLTRQADGLRDNDWPNSPEGIAALLARMDQVDLLETTSEENANMDAGSEAIDDCTIVDTNKVIDRFSP